jgi:4-amino-4-deoxy-L-arabinose transferase-like glycosyltransferase
MSPDEGASWAAASAPTAREVIARQPLLNPGELPIHDLMLHGWIALFGSNIAVMRAMSAAFGVLSISLVYIVVIALFAPASEKESALSVDDIGIVAGLAALVFAVNLVTIKYSREARMYPLMLAAILAQVTIFLRALRIGGLTNYAAVVLLTAIAIASNFAALLIPATEGLWLIYIIARARWRPGNLKVRQALMVAYALAGAGMILVPKLFYSLHAASAGDVGGWRKLPALYEPFALFNKATGSFAFPILALLAIYGVIRGWNRGARDSIAFALLWMWAPPLMMLIASYAIAPVFVERYALSCFVPFFILVAVGIFEMPTDLVRVGAASVGRAAVPAIALALAVAFSLGHIVSYDRKSHDAQYREAIAAADSALKPGEVMTVVPSYAIEVLRYYLPADQLHRAVRYDSTSPPAAVLIIGDQNLAPDDAQSYKKEYPQTVARLRGVTVLRR